MKVKAHIKYLRISPRKVRLAADVIRGLNVSDAGMQLKVLIKRSSGPLEKLLNSAIANAENNFGLSRTNLFVSEIFVNEGPTLKRWMPRAMGRAAQILKRTSHVTIVLSEINATQAPTSKKQDAKKSQVSTLKSQEDGGRAGKEVKNLDKKAFGKDQIDKAGIKGSQNVDNKKKFQRRKVI